jgi:hypothetical protein
MYARAIDNAGAASTSTTVAVSVAQQSISYTSQAAGSRFEGAAPLKVTAVCYPFVLTAGGPDARYVNLHVELKKPDGTTVTAAFASGDGPATVTSSELSAEVPLQTTDQIFTCTYTGSGTFYHLTYSGTYQIPLSPVQLTGTIVGVRPVATAVSDTGNQLWPDGRIGRHIWYEVSDRGELWTWRGTVTEEFVNQTNPCNLEIRIGQHPVNDLGQFPDTLFSGLNTPPRPECAIVATQIMKLDKAPTGHVLLEQRWRWDTSGVWKQ